MPVWPLYSTTHVKSVNISIHPFSYFEIKLILVSADEITATPVVGFHYEFAKFRTRDIGEENINKHAVWPAFSVKIRHN